MECGDCGTTNRGGARFCIGCGAPLAPVCPSCGAELPSGARFCDGCGAPVSGGRPADAAAARKTVTVLFSDLVGRADAVAAMKGLVDVTRNLRLRTVAVHALDASGSVHEVRGLGENTGGGAVEVGVQIVARVRDACTASLDYFDLDRLDDALARFEELRASADGAGR